MRAEDEAPTCAADHLNDLLQHHGEVIAGNEAFQGRDGLGAGRLALAHLLGCTSLGLRIGLFLALDLQPSPEVVSFDIGGLPRGVRAATVVAVRLPPVSHGAIRVARPSRHFGEPNLFRHWQKSHLV